MSASKDKNAQSFGRISTSGNNFTGSYSQNDFEDDDISASKSLASLGDLPAPLRQKNVTPAAVQGFQDFDDWDLEEVLEDKPDTSIGNKFSNHSQSMSPSGKEENNAWSPPKPAGKLFDQKNSNSPGGNRANKPTPSVFSSDNTKNRQ